jgi:hypothetical protein
MAAINRKRAFIPGFSPLKALPSEKCGYSIIGNLSLQGSKNPLKIIRQR